MKLTAVHSQLHKFWKFHRTSRNFRDIRGYSRTTSPYATQPIVISGISGRFPKANSTKELNEKLLKGEELTTETTSRWPDEKLPKRFGFLYCLDKFDASFFNLPPRHADPMDPQMRLLLEASFEAIVDAGMSPMELRGSQTGVFFGGYGGEAKDYRLFHYNSDEEGYQTLGTYGFMIASRIAFNLDLRGPTSLVCTACSSSFSALEVALHSIQSGQCEAAIVTASVMQLNPFDSKDYIAFNALAPDGRCKTFDESADGFTRSEAAVAILIQKEENARRCYARIRGLKSSSDGFKHAGIMHPNRVTQEDLLVKVYEEAGVDPAKVSYFEAHGTATPAGDPEEIHAVHRVFCEGRKEGENPLLIGCVKSNLGHTECAAGLVGVAKVIGAIQSGTIPANLFFNKPNPEFAHLFDGSLKVVSEPTAFDGGIVGISSMGIGGSNTHLILEPGPRNLDQATSQLPILLPLSGRSETQVGGSIAEASEHADNTEFVHLLHKAYERNIPGHSARGFGLIHPDGRRDVEVTTCEHKTRPVWVVFPGMGAQWTGMGQDLLKIDAFAESVQQSRMTLRNLGVDLDALLKIDNESIFTDIHDAFIAITVMQIALWDTLQELQVRADGFIGHSAGECLCAYADGCYTAEETLRITHARGRAMKETHKVRGGMSSIGMSATEIKSRLPPGIELACYNSPTNVTVSGEYQLVSSFTQKIKDEGGFAVAVNTCGMAPHSFHVREAGTLFKSYAQEILNGDRRVRSPRWISSSVPEAEWGSDSAKVASAEYFANNLTQPVLFHQALQHVQPSSVVIEVSPKGFFQALLAETVPSDCIHVAPMTVKVDDKLWHFFQSVGKMYNSGLDIRVEKLYPGVSTPVSSNVPSLAHLVQWDHTASWRTSILKLPLDVAYESSIDIESPRYAFLAGYKVDNSFVMPATGLLCKIWYQLADTAGKGVASLPVQFKDVVLRRAITLSPGTSTTIVYKINSSSGDFTIENQNEVVVSGNVEVLSDKPQNVDKLSAEDDSSQLVLTKEEVYKEIRLMGGNYTGLFQGIQSMDSEGRWAEITWNENWTCFLESMLHSSFFCSPLKHLALPADFEKITIDPVEFKKHYDCSIGDTGKNVVRIFNLPHQKKIIAPGIEIKGMELRTVPRILSRGNNLAFESHTFYPFYHTSGAEKTSMEVFVDLILENTTDKHLEVADVFSQKENSLAVEFTRILSRKPQHDSTVTLITLGTEAAKLEEIAKDVVGRVITKETRESLIPQTPADIIFLDDPSLLHFVFPAVKPNGFVLAHYPVGQLGNPEIKGLQKCSSRLVGGKTFDLYRKVTAQDVQAGSGFETFQPEYFEGQHCIFQVEQEISEILNVSVDSPNFAWLPEVQAALQNSKKSKCKVYLTSQGDCESGVLGFVNCLKLEDGGERIRCIFDPQGQLNLDFNEPDATLRFIISNDLFVNVYKDGELGSYRYVHIPEKEDQEAVRAGTEGFVGTLTPGDLSSLRWIESPSFEKPELHVEPARDSHYKPSLQRYKVAYAPVNLHDVLLATATIPLEHDFSYSGPYMGFEFSGFDAEGKRVMGLCRGYALATSVAADPKYVWQVPETWTLEEAATVPVAYSTVLYAFHTRARLQRGQTVLIHSGTGDVGQAAIFVALAHECKVFTTVGTEEKRDYIKKRFPQLTDDYIGNSGDTSFEAQVMDITKGRGVDLALNSLAGDRLLATVRCVAPNGSFLEIGVLDRLMNAPMGLRPLLKNVNVCGVELHHAISSVAGYDQVLGKLMKDGISSGAVKPLPRRVFESSQVEEAFRLMASGKHLGKLVVKMRDERNRKEPLNLPPIVKRSYFAANKTYLIVGGLGGFGLEVARWMVERGARKFVLNSRSGVTNGYQALCLRRWRAAGVGVQIITEDLSDKVVAERWMREMGARGETLGGIFNLALNLCDEEFSKQTVEHFQQAIKPKSCLTRNLDDISRKLCPDLEYFVAFSSLTCGLGNVGQTNYGWANSSMERICEKRREAGLHGLAIQWGIVGQVGIVSEKLLKGKEENFELQGTKAQSLHSCLEALDAALQQPFPVVSSCVLAEKRTKKKERVGLLFRMENIFGIADFKAMPGERKLSELGLDSMVAVELKNLLQREHEIPLTKEHLQLMSVADMISINAGTFDVSKFKGAVLSSQEIHTPNPLQLIEATDPSIPIFKPTEDYDASKYWTREVDQCEARGDHVSFLSEENAN